MLEQVVLAGFLAFVNNRIVEMFVEPVKKKYPDLDLWWVLYVGIGLGAMLAWVSNVNVFTELPVPLEVGRVLSAILVGGGSTVLADVLNYLQLKKVELKTATEVNKSFAHTHEEE